MAYIQFSFFRNSKILSSRGRRINTNGWWVRACCQEFNVFVGGQMTINWRERIHIYRMLSISYREFKRAISSSIWCRHCQKESSDSTRPKYSLTRVQLSLSYSGALFFSFSKSLKRKVMQQFIDAWWCFRSPEILNTTLILFQPHFLMYNK